MCFTGKCWWENISGDCHLNKRDNDIFTFIIQANKCDVGLYKTPNYSKLIDEFYEYKYNKKEKTEFLLNLLNEE